jgi:hypothetical protein
MLKAKPRPGSPPPSLHTTVHTVPYTAVPINALVVIFHARQPISIQIYLMDFVHDFQL